jgi:ATP-dependent DNA helicase RecQ
VVDVIVGADTQKVRELRHDQIKTYGAGKHKDKPFWRSLIGEMLGRGLLALDPGPYPVLKLTGACLPVLQGKETFEILELGSREKAAKKKAAAASGAAGDEGEVADVDHDLFDRLRALRKRLAGNQGIPPYMVFSDRTLHEMCRQMPMSVADFREIPGVGDNKRDKYGIEFVQEIRAYAGKT